MRRCRDRLWVCTTSFMFKIHSAQDAIMNAVDAAREAWDLAQNQRLRSLIDKLKRPIAQKISPLDARKKQNPLKAALDEFGVQWSTVLGAAPGKDSDSDDGNTFGPDDAAKPAKDASSPQRLRLPPLHPTNGLLNAVCSIADTNLSATAEKLRLTSSLKWVHQCPSLSALRQAYASLDVHVSQFGIDDIGRATWQKQRTMEFQQCLREGVPALPKLRKLAQAGVPAALRFAVWSSLLSVHVSIPYYKALLEHTTQWDLITDAYIRDDVRRTLDYDEYFVFEDQILEIMLCFTRDTKLLAERSVKAAGGKSNRSADDSVLGAPIPLNGIMPFARQTLLLAPLCYLTDSTAHIYFLFRALYGRFFIRLHTLSTDADTILPLSTLFERLAQAREPAAWFHCVSLGVQPLEIVFPWLRRAFTSILAPSEVLLLWDRIVAFDRLDILAVLAAAIFCFRAGQINRCASAADVATCFREFGTIRIMPLLQAFLFLPTD